jgi:hypothetical protein
MRHLHRTVSMLCRPGVSPLGSDTDGLWCRTGDPAGRRAGDSLFMATASTAGGAPYTTACPLLSGAARSGVGSKGASGVEMLRVGHADVCA